MQFTTPCCTKPVSIPEDKLPDARRFVLACPHCSSRMVINRDDPITPVRIASAPPAQSTAPAKNIKPAEQSPLAAEAPQQELGSSLESSVPNAQNAHEESQPDRTGEAPIRSQQTSNTAPGNIETPSGNMHTHYQGDMQPAPPVSANAHEEAATLILLQDTPNVAAIAQSAHSLGWRCLMAETVQQALSKAKGLGGILIVPALEHSLLAAVNELQGKDRDRMQVLLITDAPQTAQNLFVACADGFLDMQQSLTDQLRKYRR